MLAGQFRSPAGHGRGGPPEGAPDSREQSRPRVLLLPDATRSPYTRLGWDVRVFSWTGRKASGAMVFMGVGDIGTSAAHFGLKLKRC